MAGRQFWLHTAWLREAGNDMILPNTSGIPTRGISNIQQGMSVKTCVAFISNTTSRIFEYGIEDLPITSSQENHVEGRLWSLN